VSTILLCVRTVIHLPVLSSSGEAKYSIRAKIIRSKIAPALTCVFTPEYAAMITVHELVKARTARLAGRKKF